MDFEGRLTPAHPDDDRMRTKVSEVEAVLHRWLDWANSTISVGRWEDAALAELVHGGTARLLPEAYDGCFSGVRKITVDGEPHHVHVDLARVHTACYAIAPSVCFRGAPSFEVRFQLLGPGGAPSTRWELATMVSDPYANGELRDDRLEWFTTSAVEDLMATPESVRVDVAAAIEASRYGDQIRVALARACGLHSATNWGDLRDALARRTVEAAPEVPSPLVVELLSEAIGLDDACLVLFRDHLLVELQTRQLDGVHRYEEEGHISWQVGASTDHHCHLALGAVTAVEFCAEPSPCQQGRLNYTIWFTVDAQCGNPYRSDGYFSIVLNRPYDGDRPRTEVIEPVFDLYRRYADRPWVSANSAFLEAASCRA